MATPGRLAALLGCATIKVSGDVLDRADTEIQVISIVMIDIIR